MLRIIQTNVNIGYGKRVTRIDAKLNGNVVYFTQLAKFKEWIISKPNKDGSRTVLRENGEIKTFHNLVTAGKYLLDGIQRRRRKL